jgi:terminase small subunit-like protein
MNKMGRPTKYSEALVDTICEQIAMGRSLVNICAELDLSYSQVMVWLQKYPDFTDKYARAKEAQADWYADEIISVIDGAKSDRNEIERAKVKIEALKWVASKLKPKKYGDKLDLTSNGDRIEQPIYGGLSVRPHERAVVEGQIIKPQQIPTEVAS